MMILYKSTNTRSLLLFLVGVIGFQSNCIIWYKSLDMIRHSRYCFFTPMMY